MSHPTYYTTLPLPTVLDPDIAEQKYATFLGTLTSFKADYTTLLTRIAPDQTLPHSPEGQNFFGKAQTAVDDLDAAHERFLDVLKRSIVTVNITLLTETQDKLRVAREEVGELERYWIKLVENLPVRVQELWDGLANCETTISTIGIRLGELDASVREDPALAERTEGVLNTAFHSLQADDSALPYSQLKIPVQDRLNRATDLLTAGDVYAADEELDNAGKAYSEVKLYVEKLMIALRVYQDSQSGTNRPVPVPEADTIAAARFEADWRRRAADAARREGRGGL